MYVMDWRTPLGQLQDQIADISNVSCTWALEEVGNASLFIPRSARRFTELVEYGTIYTIRPPQLPSWTGVAEGREWRSDGVTLRLKSAEWLLGGMITEQGIVLGANATEGGISLGNAAYRLWESARKNSWTPLITGYFDASRKHFGTYSYANILKTFQALCKDEAAAFWVDEDLQLHFRNSRGTDNRTSVVLREGVELVDVNPVDSISDVLTAVVGLGEGSDVVSRPKRARQVTHPRYFRAATLDVNGATTPEALDTPVYDALALRQEPKVTIDASIVNVNNAWARIKLGDIISILYRTGATLTEATVRIIGLEVTAGSDTLRGAFEIIVSPSTRPQSEWQP